LEKSGRVTARVTPDKNLQRVIAEMIGRQTEAAPIEKSTMMLMPTELQLAARPMVSVEGMGE
jgi:hypothetical protein